PSGFHGLHRASLPTWQSGMERGGIGQLSDRNRRKPFSMSYAGSIQVVMKVRRNIQDHESGRLCTAFFISIFLCCFNSANGLSIQRTVHTITSDNGAEFAEHEFIAKKQYEFFNSAHSFLAKQEKYIIFIRFLLINTNKSACFSRKIFSLNVSTE
ncbi:hypothetical protein EZS27_033636, partial [termite gut metagenome]